ncbi:MAG: FAD-dependent oxidoreductase [Armatimonadetes bacterium]|nr:FAD-dependent oxidoreductase [Armatimonadota bacterium]
MIGAGAAGSSAARFIAGAGHEVHIFEQFEAGHTRGSSHGTSRIIRRTYPDPLYTALMDHAYALWTDLEREAHEELYVETGLLTFGLPGNRWLMDCRRSLTENRVPFEELGPVETARRCGGLHLEPDEYGLFEPGAGFLRADRVIRANLRIAAGHGARLMDKTWADARPDGTVNGEQYDAVVVCAGPWINCFIDLGLEPRLQHVAYFDAPLERDVPVWVDAGEALYFGFPDYGRGHKIGRHLYGPVVDPDEDHGLPDAAVLQELGDVARLRLGASYSLREADTCLYTVAPNEDFRIGRLPWEVPAYYISGCSGHGFKFSVWFGWLARELVEGRKQPEDYPRFNVTPSPSESGPE